MPRRTAAGCSRVPCRGVAEPPRGGQVAMVGRDRKRRLAGGGTRENFQKNSVPLAGNVALATAGGCDLRGADDSAAARRRESAAAKRCVGGLKSPTAGSAARVARRARRAASAVANDATTTRGSAPPLGGSAQGKRVGAGGRRKRLLTGAEGLCSGGGKVIINDSWLKSTSPGSPRETPGSERFRSREALCRILPCRLGRVSAPRECASSSCSPASRRRPFSI